MCGKEAFLISDLLDDIKCLRQENRIEKIITAVTRTLKRKIIDTFPKEISQFSFLHVVGKIIVLKNV